MPEFLLPLLMTIAVEELVAFVIAPRPIRRNVPWAVLFVNLLTHPLAHWIVWHDHATFLQVELLVLLTEWAAYTAVFANARWALRLALWTNLATFLLSYFV